MEDKENANLEVVVSAGYDDMTYSEKAGGVQLAVYDEEGQCHSWKLEQKEKEEDRVEGEKVIEIY